MGQLAVNRRLFLGGSAGLAVSSFLGFAPALAADGKIRMFWWGSEERARRTNEAVDAFEAANSGVQVETEFTGWDDYWTRLATQVAGRNAPDLIQMDYRYMFEYARRGAIKPLDEYLGGLLQIEDFGQANLASCRVDGKLYGINLGVNSSCVILDLDAWQETGVEPPTYGTTWEEFADKADAFMKGNKRSKFYATADASGSEPGFELWLRQHGKSLYTEDGGLGYEPADLADWFKFWGEIRAAGAAVPPDIQALYKDTIETSPVTLGYAAVDVAHSNQFVAFQQLAKQKLGMTAYPVLEGGEPGHYLKPSQMLSIISTAGDTETALKLANFLVAEPEGTKILGVERGVPASAKIRDLLTPELDEVSQVAVEFISKLEPYAGPLPPAPPPGAGELSVLLKQVSQEVSFESSSPEDAADSFVAQANDIIARG
ncbi:ABC transporter substrate-binding protein [Consotaella aegiceratis]|uniref:ABC transporter substrate-binding protein n=1 Tax=Consotaella aegiceratis TaxID=3097961 RepID=UPI002F3FBCAE